MWRAQVELQSGHKVKALRSDGGGEYVGNEMRAWMASEGIIQEFSNAYTHNKTEWLKGSIEHLRRA